MTSLKERINMFFDFFRPHEISEQENTWAYSEEPIYEKEHRETMAIIEDILNKLDEIKVLIDEMKDKDYD